MKYLKMILYCMVFFIMLILYNQPPLYAQLKTGLINSELILQSCKEMADVNKNVNELTQLYKKKLEDLDNELTAKSKQFESQSLLLSEDKKKEVQKNLENLYQKRLQYQQDKFGSGGEIERRYSELTQPIYQKINETIVLIAEEEKFDMIFDVANMGVLYANPDKTIDLTPKVLDIVNKSPQKGEGNKQ